ncbi:Drug/metabolite transporter [Cinnamomum micranthum f. kanehirae]|uniref:WAT1-related protein n=1 Tax=Cinnamomum micranthum f. kanehirae TaxID=337451 RepID=A0A3S3M2Y2_9MAGN|nr:Drug/metabolite transporter [Cinnamomum micranthum f. kanehirae]
MPLEPYILTCGIRFLGMALNAACGLQKVCRKFKPHLLMVFAQLGYTFLYFITEASFNHGMNPHVYVTYRHFVSGLAMLPFAYVLERNTRPKLTLRLLMEIFVLSILGVSLTLNMYFASLNYTSPTFLSSVVNTIASLTFVMAVMLRLERLDVRNPHGIAKVVGTLVSLAGVTAMALYKGPVVKNLWGALIHLNGKAKIHEDWFKGSILTIASCITWSIWYIMQAVTLKRYPAQLSLTTWMSFVGGAQSAVFSALVAHEPKEWIVGFNIDLWSILYSGVVCSGLIIFIQLWCTEEKGPVFVTMFNPLGTLFVAFLAYFVFGERLYTGSILGGAIVIMGLYLVLWGKEGDNADPIKSKEPSSVDSQELKEETKDATNYYGGSGDGKKSLDV